MDLNEPNFLRRAGFSKGDAAETPPGGVEEQQNQGSGGQGTQFWLSGYISMSGNNAAAG